jgi:hypothetical protein
MILYNMWLSIWTNAVQCYEDKMMYAQLNVKIFTCKSFMYNYFV